MSLKISTIILATAMMAVGCTKPVNEPEPAETNEMHFMFENYFGAEELSMNADVSYTTLQGEEITKVTAFNYWITNIKLVKSDGTEFAESESYRLVRADKGSTNHFHIPGVPAGTYTGVKFMVGVDVARNTSGAQTGDLDPAVNDDMFWTWSTGYIQAKMEGLSPQSTNTDQTFEYHIGGVAAGKETPREVTLTFPSAIEVGEKAGSLKIKTDAAKWFGPTNPVKIAMMSNMTHPGDMAVKIADNYKEMFSIMSAGNE